MEQTIEDAEDRYMNGLCAAFAYALWIAHGRPAAGQIGILSADDHEPYSDEIPFDPTHAYYDTPSSEMDVYGLRNPQAMAESLGVAGWSLYGPYQPDEFLNLFTSHHKAENRPLEAPATEIEKALDFIRHHKKRYELPPS